MLNTITNINKLITDAKPKFAQYISDVSIPLSTRWELFVIANEGLKDTRLCVVYFKNLPEDFIMYDGQIHAERREYIDSITIIEQTEEAKEYSRYENIDVNALKEEILAMNLAGFTYDW